MLHQFIEPQPQEPACKDSIKTGTLFYFGGHRSQSEVDYDAPTHSELHRRPASPELGLLHSYTVQYDSVLSPVQRHIPLDLRSTFRGLKSVACSRMK